MEMVHEFYHLREEPFGVTPDPRFLFMSPTHREALASLQYGIQQGRGFLSLIARPGMGKTTILFQLLQSIGDSARTVFLFRTSSTPKEFLKGLLADLNLETSDDTVAMQAQLTDLLIEESRLGRRLILVVDEAQALDSPVFETLRMLSNFETPREKLLQIVLCGQPQLAEKLASPGLTQLRQRISIFTRLEPLTAQECGEYIAHRLRTAGYVSRAPFFYTTRAIDLIHRHSHGIPRNINNICFNAMSLGFATRQPIISSEIIQEVIADLRLKPQAKTIAQLALRRLSSLRKHFDLGHFGWFIVVATVLLLGGGLTALRFPVRRAAEKAVTLQIAVTPPPTQLAPAQVPDVSSNEELTEDISPTIFETKQVSRSDFTVGLGKETDRNAYREILIAPNQTVYGISRKVLGQYDCVTRDQILALNPWLQNPNVVRPGQTLRLPLKASRELTGSCTIGTISLARNSVGEERKP